MDPAVREGLATELEGADDGRGAGDRRRLRGDPGPAVASVGTAIFIGWILVIAGAFLVAGAFTAHSIGTVVLRLLWALLTVIVGLCLIVEPHNGTLTLTLVLGIYFLFMGLTRIAVAFAGRGQQGAGLVGLSGVAGLLIGILVLAKFPSSRRLGDRPPGRHRPDLRRLDPDIVALVGKDLSRADRTLLARRVLASSGSLAAVAGASCAWRCSPRRSPRDAAVGLLGRVARWRGSRSDSRRAAPPLHRRQDPPAEALSSSSPAPSTIRRWSLPWCWSWRRARERACVPRCRRCCTPSAGGRWSPGRSSPRARRGAGRVVAIVSPKRRHRPPACPTRSEIVIQPEPDGTGGAVRAALPLIEEAETVLVLSGDVPLISAETIAGLLEAHAASGAAATMLTIELDDPGSYGRVVRTASGEVERVVEAKAAGDADARAARDPRDQRRHLRLRRRRRSPRPSPASPTTTPRASTTCPTSCRPCARRATRSPPTSPTTSR